jgi:hypothetical protein
MAKTIAEKIEGIKVDIKQSEKRLKQLIQEQKAQERKDRTRRLCKRAGLLESLLPDTITLTDEHFKTFLEKALLSDYSRKLLNGLAIQAAATPPVPSAGSAAQYHPAPAANLADTKHDATTSGHANAGANHQQTRSYHAFHTTKWRTYILQRLRRCSMCAPAEGNLYLSVQIHRGNCIPPNPFAHLRRRYLFHETNARMPQVFLLRQKKGAPYWQYII